MIWNNYFFNILISIITKIIPFKVAIVGLELCRYTPFRLGLFLRYLFLRAGSKSIGKNVYIGCNVNFKGIENLVIKNNVSIHENCHINAIGGVSIGENVSIAHNSTIISRSHTYEDKLTPIKYNPILDSPVVIKDDTWIGAGVRILFGVTVNQRCIIGANSVVNKSCKSNSVYGGIPCKKLKDLL